VLPRYYAKDTITIYTYFSFPDSESFTFKRFVLRDCVWEQKDNVLLKHEGTLNVENLTIKISYRDCLNYRDKFDVLKLAEEAKGSYIIKGECDHEFPDSAIDPDEFIADYLIPFENEFKPARPKQIIPRFYGARPLWHVEVKC